MSRCFLCARSTWEPTPYTLQMSSCLIINPAFHAYVNFIITDTCIRSEGLHVCARTQPHVRTSLLQTATVEEQLHQRQLSLISLYLRHLFLAFLFLTSVTSHIFFFFRLLIPLCFSLFVSYPVCFSPLPLFALPTCQGDSPPKRSDVFCFIFISHFWRVHFFFLVFSFFFFFF